MSKLKFPRKKCVYKNCNNLCHRVEVGGRIYLYPDCLTHYVGRERMLAYWRKRYYTNELFKKNISKKKYEKYHSDYKYREYILYLTSQNRIKRLLA